jgi:uncharacterized repeat protein (TIGR03803 family)
MNPIGGRSPRAGLTTIGGAFYGELSYGGSGGGTIFHITTAGIENTVYAFKKGTTDGETPMGGLVELGGKLFGTTASGGQYAGIGTVFQVTAAGVENILHQFKGGSDGMVPFAGLINVAGTLYGTTVQGGHCGLANGCGTVFSVTPGGTENIIYAFKGGVYGFGPETSLLYLSGVFYGTTESGGTGGWGTVFSVTPSGIEHVLHSFAGGTDGRYPHSNLIYVNNALYGTTYNGGTGCPGGCGTVFKITNFQ